MDDVDSALALLWLLVAVGGSVVLLMGTLSFVGWEVDSLPEAILAGTSVLGTLAWIAYCTWRISVGYDTPAVATDKVPAER